MWRQSDHESHPKWPTGPLHHWLMCKNIGFAPAGEIERRAVGNEVEAGACDLEPTLARQERVELLLQLVQVKDVAGGVDLLLLAERLGAPVRGLLLLRDVDAEQ